MSEYVIETGIPLPERCLIVEKPIPFADMNVGDSVFIPALPCNVLKARARVQGRVNTYAKANPGTKFMVSAKLGSGGVRVWRTA
jgi:hypothetical protein